MPFYKYRTDLGNTVTAKSTNSFTGLTGNEAQISSTIDTPSIQSVNLYKVVAGNLVDNDDTTINNYYKSVGVVTQGSPTYNQFTGYTATTAPAQFQSKVSINIYTGTTAPGQFASKINFNTYTGTTAPGMYLTKSAFNTYSGTTEPALYASKIKFNTYTGTTAPAQFQSHSSILTLTGTTLPLTYQSKSSIVTLTGTTLGLTYQSKSSIVTLTGTTLPLTYQSKSSIVTLTGTTLPATYASKSVFNTYTGTTAPARYFPKSGGTVTGGLAVGGSGSYGGSLGVTGSITEGGIPLVSKYLTLSAATTTYQSKSSIIMLTGTTLPATYASKSIFNTYTGTTAPGQFAAKTNFNSFTGTTAPATYHTKSAFNSFTGTTLPLTYQSKSSIVTLTGTTLGLTYVAKSVFSTYTGGTTNVTSAGNGIRKNGNNVRLGGSLTGSTNIGLGTFNLIFTGASGTLRYGSDLSASYNVRSLVDLGYVTANTNSTLIFKNNATQLNTPPVEFTTVNFSSGATLVNRGSGVLEVKVIYGSEVFSTGKTTTQTNTTTFADYLAKGFTLAGGTYKIEYVIKMSNSATGNLGAQLLVDGVSLESGTVTGEYNTSSKGFTICTFGVKALAAGAHSFRLQFNSSNGTVTADYGQILITRIS